MFGRFWAFCGPGAVILEPEISNSNMTIPWSTKYPKTAQNQQFLERSDDVSSLEWWPYMSVCKNRQGVCVHKQTMCPLSKQTKASGVTTPGVTIPWQANRIDSNRCVSIGIHWIWSGINKLWMVWIHSTYIKKPIAVLGFGVMTLRSPLQGHERWLNFFLTSIESIRCHSNQFEPLQCEWLLFETYRFELIWLDHGVATLGSALLGQEYG